MSTRLLLPPAGWVALTLGGWLLESVTLAVLAPLALLPLPLVLARRRRDGSWLPADPFEPVWLVSAVFAFAYLLVPALYAERPRAFSSLGAYLDVPPGDWQMALVLSGVAFIAFLVGYFGPFGEPVRRVMPRPGAPAGPAATGVIAAALFAVGALSVAAAVYVNDGLSLPPGELLTGALRDETVSSFSGRGYLSLGFAMLALSIPCGLAYAAEARGRAHWLILGTATVAAEVMLGGIVGSRILALVIPLSMAAVYHYRVRGLTARAVVVVALCLALLGAVVAVARGSASARDPLEVLGVLSLTLDGFNFLVNSVARVEDFRWGMTILEDALLTYLPRDLWDAKPVVYGFVSAQEAVVPGLYQAVTRGSTYPVGMVAEGYLNFGVVGVVLLPALTGAFLRGLYLRLLESADAFYVLVLAWLLANVITLFRGVGMLIPQLAVTVLVLSPLLLGPRPWTLPRRAARGGRTELATRLDSG